MAKHLVTATGWRTLSTAHPYSIYPYVHPLLFGCGATQRIHIGTRAHNSSQNIFLLQLMKLHNFHQLCSFVESVDAGSESVL